MLCYRNNGNNSNSIENVGNVHIILYNIYYKESRRSVAVSHIHKTYYSASLSPTKYLFIIYTVAKYIKKK